MSLSDCITSEEGFYKYLRSITVERYKNVPELSGSHVPAFEMQIMSLSTVTCAQRRREAGEIVSSLRQIAPDVCIVLQRRFDLFIPALNQTFGVRMFNFTSEKNQFPGENINPTHSYPNTIT